LDVAENSVGWQLSPEAKFKASRPPPVPVVKGGRPAASKKNKKGEARQFHVDLPLKQFAPENMST